ncbi:hypothetical protein DPMN_180171 [Dreissena polymorpha]|uniref:Uncharacterized protein n=1 Tax=Dreissena polymorpha TaxID=45954 RepID=A0A9D4IK83_DREPO|nr:hypothetical protein DPMN_180171 [Dreissena polymorpha]
MSKFHEDNVSSRLFTCFHFIHIKKTAPPPGAHVFPLITAIFKLVRDIHIAYAKNVTSREKDPPPGGHVFLPIQTIFELNCRIQAQNIIGTNLLTKFYEDRKINVVSRVLTRKNAPLPGSHVFQPTGIIFELIQDIIGMNLLPKFHEDRTVNVASRVLTRFYYSHIKKNAPPLGSHFFQASIIIFELIQDIIETNLLTKFHEDWTINEKCPAPGGHVFKATKTIFKLIQDIIRTNLLTKFQDDRKINVTSRVLTRKIAPPLWWPYIIGMNLLIEFHEDRTINVVSRVKNAPPLGCHVIQANVTIFELIQDIIKTNLLAIFRQDWTINMASRVLTRKNAPPPWRPYAIGMNLLTKKNAPPLGSHVFQAKVTIFNLIKDISGTNLLSKFHEDGKINVASRVKCPAPWGPYIIGMNLLNKFHEDQIINVASRVLTRFYYSHIRKNAPPLGSHVFQANVTIFELIQDIIETNLLTKFHEDWTINVASRE